jgi:hypothetical protein
VTGKEDAEEAAKVVMARPGARTQWAVVKMGGKGALLRARGSDTTFTCPGYKVGRGGGGCSAKAVVGLVCCIPNHKSTFDLVCQTHDGQCLHVCNQYGSCICTVAVCLPATG